MANAAQQKRYRNKRRSNGLCPFCPNPLPPPMTQEHRTIRRYCCDTCRELTTAQRALRRAMKRTGADQ